MQAPSSPLDTTTPVTARLLRAGGWHPVQIEALTILSEREASPKQIAVELGLTKAKSSYVSYHVRKLQERGLVRLVRTVPVRGVKERFYKASAPFVVMGETAERMSLQERLGLSSWTISCINRDFLSALEAKSIDERTDRHLTRVPLLLDEQALAELFEVHNQLFYRIKEIQVESDRRRENSGEIGHPVSATIASFLMPGNQLEPASNLQTPSRTDGHRPPSSAAVEKALTATARMLRGGWQPTQIQALTILSERVASPKEIALELGLPAAKAGLVSYHVKELLARGQVELIKTVPVRGANEHFYAATVPFAATAEDADSMTLEERLVLSCWAISCINRDFMRAVESASIDERLDRHLTRSPLHLDVRGIEDVFAEQDVSFQHTLELQAESNKRHVQSGQSLRAASAVIAGFLMPHRLDDSPRTNPR